GASGWLAATLSGTSAPATLSLPTSIARLAAGTYTASITVSSSMQGVAPKTISMTLYIRQSFSLTTSASPADGGTVERTPNQSTYDAGASVSLRAVPRTGWHFVNWSGDVTGTA